MPLTPFQLRVLEVIRSVRCEESHFAGGIVLNAADSSSRFSKDFDLFHNASEMLAESSVRDVEALERAGFDIVKYNANGSWDSPGSFRRARVSQGGERVDIDWAEDTAWRFFPILEDARLGYRLHLFDVAINKAFALSARSETRDLIDMVSMAERYTLEGILWAACGIEGGWTPLSLLEMVRRFARIDPGTVDEIKARDIDPVDLKTRWSEMSLRAGNEITRVADAYPDLPIGVAFVDSGGKPGWIGDDPSLALHAPTIKGCWPHLHGVEIPTYSE